HHDTLLIFFVTDTADTDIYTLSLHDALPISEQGIGEVRLFKPKGVGLKEYHIRVFSPYGQLIWESRKIEDGQPVEAWDGTYNGQDRKSTRLNSSHVKISYAVFCLKKKKNTEQ